MVETAGSNPASASAGSHGPLRSAGTTTRSHEGTKPFPVMTSCLNTRIPSRSISNRRTSPASPSRNARASRPAARITTCLQPWAHAWSMRSSKNLVRTVIQSTSADARRRCAGVSTNGGVDVAAATKADANGSSNNRSGRSLSAARTIATPRAVALTGGSASLASGATSRGYGPSVRERWRNPWVVTRDGAGDCEASHALGDALLEHGAWLGAVPAADLCQRFHLLGG